MIRALVAEGSDDLFIAEDSHQRIYGNRIVLGRYGIRIVGRSQRLTLNYRTTAQNLRYAMAMLDGGAYADLKDEAEVTGCRSARSRPGPSVETVDSWSPNSIPSPTASGRGSTTARCPSGSRSSCTTSSNPNGWSTRSASEECLRGQSTGTSPPPAESWS